MGRNTLEGDIKQSKGSGNHVKGGCLAYRRTQTNNCLQTVTELFPGPSSVLSTSAFTCILQARTYP